MNSYRSALFIGLLYQTAMAGPMSVLSLVLRDQGIGIHEIGVIMAATTVTMMLGTVGSGFAIGRYGALRTMIGAMLCALVALVSFEWTITDAAWAFASRLLQGIGFGLFLTASIVFVRSHVAENRQTEAMGIMSAMPLVPYFFAQFVAEWYLREIGTVGLFLVWAFPLALALSWASFLPPEAPAAPPGKSGSYRAALRPSVGAWPGYLCMAINGTVWGFGASFMPIMLNDTGLLIGVYFTPMAAVALFGRFVLLGRVRQWPTLQGLATGMSLLAAGALLPAYSLSLPVIVLAGVVYGLAYSMIGPISLTWVAGKFVRSDQPKPLALTQTFFQLGALAAPILASWAYGTIGLPIFLACLGLVGALMATLLSVLESVRRFREEPV